VDTGYPQSCQPFSWSLPQILLKRGAAAAVPHRCHTDGNHSEGTIRALPACSVSVRLGFLETLSTGVERIVDNSESPCSQICQTECLNGVSEAFRITPFYLRFFQERWFCAVVGLLGGLLVLIGGSVESFSDSNAVHGSRLEQASSAVAPEPTIAPGPALIAVYDNLTSSPRVERIVRDSARDLIEELATRTYQISHEAGGKVPYMVIREIVENFIHAGFDEVVVSVLDGGNTLRFADQGPGIRDKDRAFLPGFTTATDTMKRVIKGVGSGLPVARECLTFSEGTIDIDDNLGVGTVVTLRVTPPQEIAPVVPRESPQVRRSEVPTLDLSVRHKKVLSLVMEVGALGPSLVARELGVGLSTAYRDLEHLAEMGFG